MDTFSTRRVARSICLLCPNNVFFSISGQAHVFVLCLSLLQVRLMPSLTSPTAFVSSQMKEISSGPGAHGFLGKAAAATQILLLHGFN